MDRSAQTDFRIRIVAPRTPLHGQQHPVVAGLEGRAKETAKRLQTLEVNGSWVEFVGQTGNDGRAVRFESTVFDLAAAVALITLVLLVALHQNRCSRLPGSRRSE